MVRSQLELSLRAMTESLAIQWQGSMSMLVAHVTTREHGAVPGKGSRQGPRGRPGAVSSLPCPSLGLTLWRAGPSWWQHSGEPRPGSTVELALTAGVWVNQPLEDECGRADAVTHLPWGGTATQMATSGSWERAHRVMSLGKLTLSLTSHDTWEKGPAPHLDSIAGLTLVIGAGEGAHR